MLTKVERETELEPKTGAEVESILMSEGFVLLSGRTKEMSLVVVEGDEDVEVEMGDCKGIPIC